MSLNYVFKDIFLKSAALSKYKSCCGIDVLTSSTDIKRDYLLIKSSEYRDKSIVTLKRKESIPMSNGELIIHATMASKQYYNRKVPPCLLERMRSIYDDPRLCCSGFLINDQPCKNGDDEYDHMIVGFLMTDSVIYAYYERRHCKKSLFVGLVPVQRRRGVCHLDDFYKLRVSFDIDRKIISWMIEGSTVYQVNRVGYKLPDQYMVLNRVDSDDEQHLTEIFPTSVQVEIGNYMFEDFQLPNNSCRELTYRDLNVDTKESITRSTSGLVAKRCDKYREVFVSSQGTYPEVGDLAFTSSDCYVGQGAFLAIKNISAKRIVPKEEQESRPYPTISKRRSRKNFDHIAQYISVDHNN